MAAIPGSSLPLKPPPSMFKTSLFHKQKAKGWKPNQPKRRAEDYRSSKAIWANVIHGPTGFRLLQTRSSYSIRREGLGVRTKRRGKERHTVLVVFRCCFSPLLVQTSLTPRTLLACGPKLLRRLANLFNSPLWVAHTNERTRLTTISLLFRIFRGIPRWTAKQFWKPNTGHSHSKENQDNPR